MRSTSRAAAAAAGGAVANTVHSASLSSPTVWRRVATDSSQAWAVAPPKGRLILPSALPGAVGKTSAGHE